MNNKILLVLLIASLGFNAFFVVTSLKGKAKGDSLHETNQPSKSLSVDEGIVFSKEELTNKNSDDIKISNEAETKELEAKIEALESHIRELKKPKISAGGFSDDIDDPAVAKAIEAPSEAIARFEKEAINYAWSNDTKNKLHQVFADNALNSEMQIKDMECKTSVCKLSVSPYAGSSQGHLMGAGIRVLGAISESEQDELTGLGKVFNLDTDKEQIDIFLYNND